MTQYIAHYKSLDSNALRAKGEFLFESDSKINSKNNMQDARIKMLEKFGNDAISWQIINIEKKKKTDVRPDGQLELDFRDPVKKKRKHTKKYL